MPKILTPEQREASRLRRRQLETERQREARRRDPERYRLAARASRDRRRAAIRARKRERWSTDPVFRLKQQDRRRAWAQRLRRAAFDAYGGPICRCCAEERESFLCFDHIDGGGNAHRREIGQAALPQWLKQHGYPPGFRPLCHNCNVARACYGACPHELEIDEEVERFAFT